MINADNRHKGCLNIRTDRNGDLRIGLIEAEAERIAGHIIRIMRIKKTLEKFLNLGFGTRGGARGNSRRVHGPAPAGGWRRHAPDDRPQRKLTPVDEAAGFVPRMTK